MNASLLSTAVVILFFLFVVSGFVFGWIRGLNKSLTRFIMVLIVGVLAFFVVPPITKAVLAADISKFGITINGTTATTLQNLIVDLLSEVPFINDILHSSATFSNFIQIIPQMLVNVVLFVVFFFVVKWLTMIIYWIIAGVCFNKKKMGDKDRHRFIGATIGAVQGLIVTLVVFVPIFGVLQTARPVVEAVRTETTTQTQSLVAYADDQGSQGQTDQIDQTFDRIMPYYDAVNNNWIVKVMGAVGFKQLSTAMFDGLTTVKKDKTEFALRREVTTIAGAYPDFKNILDGGFNIKDNQKLESLANIINKLYESKVLSGMVKEVIPAVADTWIQGATFCGMSKPNFKDESISQLFDSLLRQLSQAGEGDTIKNDLLCGVDLLKIVNNAGLLEAVSGDSNIMDVLNKDGNEHLIADIIEAALKSDTLRAVLPDVINVGMNYVYDSLKIDKDTIDKIPSNAECNWDNEKPILQKIFTDVFDIYDQITGEGSDPNNPLHGLDFAKLGNVFDNLRASQLLHKSSLGIMKALLSSEKIVGSDNEILKTLTDKLIAVWDEDVSLTPTFVSIGNALTIAKQMQDAQKDLDLNNLGDLIEQLADAKDSGVLGDLVDQLVSEKTLTDLGVDEKTAGVVSETLGEILGAEYEDGDGLKKEIEAAKGIYEAAGGILNSEDGAGSIENPKDLVDKLAESSVLLDKLAEPGQEGEKSKATELLEQKLSPDAKNDIEEEINKWTPPEGSTMTEEEQQQVKEKLKNLFGLGQ